MTTIPGLPAAPAVADDGEELAVNAPLAPADGVAHKTRRRTIGAILVRVYAWLTTTQLAALTAAILGTALVQGGVTPVWGAATTPPVLGNGTLTGRVTRIGNRVRANITLTLGSTSTMGTGAWNFSLPAPHAGNAVATAVGSVVGRDTAGSLWRTGSCRILAGTNLIRVVSNGIAGEWASAVPHTWANGDAITLSIEYEIP
jgi:hypothetical protein